MGVSKNRGKTPQIINCNRPFHYKPSILGVFPLFLETPISKFQRKFFRSSQVTGVPQLSIIHSFIDHHMPEGTCTSPTNDLLGCTNDTGAMLQDFSKKSQRNYLTELQKNIWQKNGMQFGLPNIMFYQTSYVCFCGKWT